MRNKPAEEIIDMPAMQTMSHEKRMPYLRFFVAATIVWTVAAAVLVGDLSNRIGVRHALVIVIVWLLGVVALWFALRKIGLASLSLQESEERYRMQFQQSRAMMLIVDPDGGAVIDANPAACSFYGYGRATLLTLKISDIDTCSPEELAVCIAALQNGDNGQFTARHRHSDGTIMDVEVFSNPVVFGGKTVHHSIIVDISGRLVAERELRDKMDFAENLVLNSTTPTFVINSDHQVLIWNRALEELTGVKAQEVIGTEEQWRAFYPSARPCLADIVLEEKRDEVGKLYSHVSSSRLIPDSLRAEGDYSFDNRRCRLVFSAAPVRDRAGGIIAAIQTLEDITERISLEAQLFQSQKMESVGELASGIAHDFNNVLTVINGYADLLMITLPDNEESQQIGREILASVDRAAGMTRSLLAFSGKHELQLHHDDLNQILAAIRKSLTRLIREDITLVISPGEQPLPVLVDRVQVEQILINLVVNARDAVGTGGIITVSTSLVHCEEARTEGDVVILPGQYACLSVRDNGGGMNDKTLKRIFEPFFTTKDRGNGTGLGLAIVNSIVTKLAGHVSVTTMLGSGTEFRAYLPLAAVKKPQRVAEIVASASHHGTETVLVVEDDAAIMKLHREVLSRYGYEVLTAVDGVEAMEVFGAHHDKIRILVVDVIMPRMNGREVVELVRRLSPDMPIIMTSGYTDDIVDRTALDSLKVMFMQKPVKPLELLAAMRARLQDNE